MSEIVWGQSNGQGLGLCVPAMPMLQYQSKKVKVHQTLSVPRQNLERTFSVPRPNLERTFSVPRPNLQRNSSVSPPNFERTFNVPPFERTWTGPSPCEQAMWVRYVRVRAACARSGHFWARPFILRDHIAVLGSRCCSVSSCPCRSPSCRL